MQANYTALGIVIAYMAGVGLLSLIAQRSVKSTRAFMTGTSGVGIPAVLVGLVLMSEYVGTPISVGTAQASFRFGVSAAWNVIAIASGFLIFGFFLAKQYKSSPHNTISAIFDDVYGSRSRLAVSLVMIFALEIAAVSLYASGGAILSALLGTSKPVAIIICGLVSVLYVFTGGMKSVLYTNLIHVVLKFVSVIIALYFGLSHVGGFWQLHVNLQPEMFSWTNIGIGQIFAWFIAGAGSIFTTQYIIQAIGTAANARDAKIASFVTAALLVVFGILLALVGMCSRVLFSDIKPIDAFPHLIVQMDGISAGIVSAGLAASLFGAISAISVATATLIYKDFYVQFSSKEHTERGSLTFIRIATAMMGLLPIVLAIYSPNILAVAFLGKALRASLSVLVLFVFYAPWFGDKAGAFWSILLSLFATVGWYMLGNPFGINYSYIALAVPLVTMVISHVFRPSLTITPSEMTSKN